jgi:hypothetical protein
VPRKTGVTLDEQRNAIKSRYKRGKKTAQRIVGEDALSVVELATKKEAACFLKSADYSYIYIAEALNVTRSMVKMWFEDEAMRQRVAEIQTDFLDGAVKLLRTYAIELIEMLVEIARYTEDDKVAIQAITEALDRMGLSKVNKSESAATNVLKSEFDITDKTGLSAAMKDAPPEVQQEMARKMEEMMVLASEHTGRNMNDG